MKNKLISLSIKTILIESGIDCFREGGGVESIFAQKVRLSNEFDIDLLPLIYGRNNPPLAHTLPSDVAQDNVLDAKALAKELNENGLSFNLALNGSPSYYNSVPLNSKELDFLSYLQKIGTEHGLENSVTISDNALLPLIRRECTELEIIASCIAPQFKPNIDWFKNAFPDISDDEELLIKYYEYLYATHDKVVPMAQLSNPKFLSHFTQIPGALANKTIVFLYLRCAQLNLGGCSGHYFNNRINISGMPTIPTSLYNEELGTYDKGDSSFPHCRVNPNHTLINRPTDALWMLKHGIWQYKVPARNTSFSQNIERFFSLTKATTPITDFPTENPLWGYNYTRIKIDFLLSYPEKVWPVLESMHWPKYDSNGGDAYCGHSAYDLKNDLHARAVKMWEEFK